MNRTTRLLLGLIALGILAVGGIWVLEGSDSPTGGVLLRVGVILGAVWLVAPLIRKPGLAGVIGLAAGALVMVRPKLIWALVAAAVIWWASRRTPSRS